jgi:hypothetical protein
VNGVSLPEFDGAMNAAVTIADVKVGTATAPATIFTFQAVVGGQVVTASASSTANLTVTN